ncbi:MAG: M16 family metallopeptidase [Candidatus Hodarchaeota archaeon]
MSEEKSIITTLNNNLKVQLVLIPGARTSLFSVGFHAGSMYEEGFGAGSNDGISHFLEHMFFKGIPGKKTSKQINDEFTRLGAELNAGTSYDHTIYYAKVPTRNFRKAAEIWKELLINKTLDPIEFKAEKQVVLQEIQWYEDMPEMNANNMVRKKHFTGTALEHNITGTLDSVSAITLEMMTEYIKRFYSLDNAVVTLVGGDFDLEEEKNFLTSLFNESIPQPKLHPIFPPSVTMPIKKSQINYFKSATSKPLCYVALNWNTPGINSTDFWPLLVLNTYIGNSRTSLLYREVISKGIASVCRYGFEALYDISSATILFVTPPERTEEVFQKVINLLIHIYSVKITPNIVNALKEEIWGSYLSEIEDPTNYGIDLLTKYLKFRKPLPIKDFQQKIQVSHDEVQDAKDSFLEKLNLTVYATGAVPQDWEPQFPKESPW